MSADSRPRDPDGRAELVDQLDTVCAQLDRFLARRMEGWNPADQRVYDVLCRRENDLIDRLRAGTDRSPSSGGQSADS